jgi:serine/threonine-protein kinase
MTNRRIDWTANAETEPDPEYESWLRKGAHAPVHALPRLPALGQIIGDKYRIEEALGTGGMGAVFRATHMVSHKAVALKWLLRPASDERALTRFAREARAAGRIDHPSVVDVYDIGREGDASYLVMELLHGESLRKRLGEGRIPSAEAIDLLLPAMHGVAAAHAEGVVHRDLKPDNIFLCRGRNGEPRPAKVLDFGVSSITSAEDVASSLTTEGTVLGTPSYMAPEQLMDASDVDARADIYAFGVILYEVLTGRLPFIADTYLGLALAITQSVPVKPRELQPDIPSELQRVVLRAMHKRPSERPRSMAELIALLAPFGAAPHAPAEHASSERLRISPSARKSWPARAALAALALLLTAAGVWASRRATETALTPATGAPRGHVTAPAPAPDTAAPAHEIVPAPMPEGAPQPGSHAEAARDPAQPAAASEPAQPRPSTLATPATASDPPGSSAAPAATRTPAANRTRAPRRAEPTPPSSSAAPAAQPAKSTPRVGAIHVDEL